MSPFARLAIPQAILEEVVAHARAELPNECCGLLAGTIDGVTGTVGVRFPIGNDAASPCEFTTNPRDLLDAFRALRDRGLELLALYHSHPSSAPIPSRRDLERNTYGDNVVHLIVGLAGRQPEVRGWWLDEEGFREAPVQ